MECPRCSSSKSSVTDSRSDRDLIRRRRLCQSCGARFTTLEKIEASLPLIVKKDGRRESFEPSKVRGGLLRACEKRPISVETIDQVVESIERRLVELCEKEVSSITIGEFVMQELRDLDQIAYIRFASVYREFSDVSQFVDTLNSLVSKSKTRKGGVGV